MAQNDINIGLNVSSNGTLDKENAAAQKLAAALKSAETAASGTSKALSSAKMASASKAKTAAPTTEEGINYGIQRAAVGTGAASRDFAQQSQGLGGLVRLYATFAANIFAVTAAFTALSNAADTSNLIKGLDQLGANSGRALGSLAKKLSDASEGAISLRDSMESVAKASSAGLNDSQIQKLGDSAKKAAQALGLSMPDALGRLTRGISKLEPELLDELGIFVRIDDATRKYALSIGKSSASLSDFERRQAFANAVLTQAQEKFGAIQIDVNPYAKLLASFQNISFAGLELVNKVLGPLVKLLSESPGALAALLGAIGVKLVSTALPAIGAWRLGLKAAAEQAAKTSDAISKSFGDNFNSKLEATFRIPALEKNLDRINKKIADVMAKSSQVEAAPASLTRYTSVTNASADEKGLASVNKVLKQRQEYLDTGLKGAKNLTVANRAQYEAEVAYLKKVQASIGNQIEKNTLLIQQKRAMIDLEEGRDKALNFASKKQNFLDTEIVAYRQAEKARLNLAKVTAVSNAADLASTLGVRLAWSNLNKEIQENGITGISKYTTLARGGLAAVGARLAGIASAFGVVGQIAAVAFIAFEGISYLLSTNAKQAERFTAALEETNKAVETLKNTMTNIGRKDPISAISVDSLLARNTAIVTLTSSLVPLADKLDEVARASSLFDKTLSGESEPLKYISPVVGKIFQKIAPKILGKDFRGDFNKAFVPALVDAFNKMPEDSAKEALGNKLKSIYNIAAISADSVKESLKDLSLEDIAIKTRDAGSAAEEYSDSLKKNSSQLSAFQEAQKTATKAYQEFSASFALSDPMSKLGSTLTTFGVEFSEGFKEPTNRATILQNVLKDTAALSLVPEGTRKELINYRKELDSSIQSLDTYNKRIVATSDAIALLEKSKVPSFGGEVVDNSAFDEEISRLQELQNESKVGAAKMLAAQQEASAKFSSVGTQIFLAGVQILEKSVTLAKQRAALGVEKALNSQLSGFAKITADTGTRLKEIEIQTKAIDVQEELVVQQTKTNFLLEQGLLRDRQAELTLKGAGRNSKENTELERLPAALDNLEGALSFIESKSKDPSKTTEGVYKLLGALVAQTIAGRAKREELRGQASEAKISGAQATSNLEFKNIQDIAKAKVDILNIDKSSLEVYAGIVGAESKISALVKYRTDYEIDNNTGIIAIAEIKRQMMLNTARGGADVVKENEALEKQEALLRDQFNARQAIRLLTKEIAIIEANSVNAAKKASFDTELASLRREIALAEVEASKEYLDYLIKIGAVSESSGIRRSADLENQLALQKQAADVAAISAAAAAERATALSTNDKAQLAAGSNEQLQVAAQKQAEESLARIDALEEERIKKIKLQTDAKRELLALTSKEAEQSAKINEFSSTLAKIFEGLGDSASKFGSGFGNAIKVFSQIGNRRVAIEKETNSKLAKIDQSTKEGMDNYYSAKEEGAKRSAEFEIDAAAESAGAAKNMFSEKTFAFKAFAAVEKAIHVAKLAMMVQEMLTSLATVGPIVAAEGTKSAAKGTSAILSALSAPFPVNFVAGAMMAAIVASLLGGKAKSVEIPAGMSAKDRQETQGTGMSWVNGKKAENGTGVFGDASAKSQSIPNALEVIKKTSVEGLTFSNKMVSLLSKINEGINGAAKTLYSIPGIRTGSQFGTTEGTNTSGGFLGIGGLFSKSTTQTIIDSGIKISGTFAQILNDTKGVIRGYETVSTTVKKSGLFGIGGSTKTSVSDQFTNLDSAVTSQITEVFQHATDLFIDAGGKLGLTVTDVMGKLANIKVDQLASLKGLSGADLEKELNAILSNILDTASNTLFSSLDKYKKFGEGMLETVIRVIDSNEKIKQAFDSIGQHINTIGFEVSEGLTKAAGGLSDLLDSVSNYKDKFFTEAEQLIPIQAAVTRELTSLGFASVKTREDFKFLVAGLDLATNAGQETYVKLLNVADSFDRLAQAADETDNLRIDLLEAEGKTVEATALRRAKELKQLSATDAAIKRRIYQLQDEKQALEDKYSLDEKILSMLGKTAEALKLSRAKQLEALDGQLLYAQKYIFAIEDEISIRDRATKAVESTTNSLKNSISTLKEFKSSLLGGDKSILTPQQKYEQARKEAEAVINASTASASTVEEILVREAAISKLPAVTTTWLEASRNLYASSQQYTKDFNTVLSALDSTSVSLQSQLTDAEKQYQVLKDSSNILSAIDDNTLRTSDLMSQFISAVTATKDAGVAYNNFVPAPTTSVTVPTTVDSVSTINAQLIEELLKFNREALDRQLKADAENTAAIIRANAIAEAANAEAIAKAQLEAANNANWRNQNIPVQSDWDASYFNGGGGGY